MIRHYFKAQASRHKDRERLNAIQEQILTDIPGSAISADQAYREADLAIDFCEDVTPLSMERVQKIVEIFESHGALAKVSSIHVNGWFGNYDKCSMSRHLLRQVFLLNEDQEKTEVLYVGDSPNDCPMVQAFPISVGVANVLDFKAQLNLAPAWITEKRGGYGFSEMAEFLISQQKL